MKEKIQGALGVLCVIALIAVCVVIVVLSDNSAPVINVGDINVEYYEGADKSVLLWGVTARDKEDGDVTDSIIVEKIVIVENGTKAMVYYVAKDSRNSIARACKIVDYKDTASIGEDETSNADETQTESRTEKQKETQTESATSNELPSSVAESPVISLVSNEITVKIGEEPVIYRLVDQAVDNKDSKDVLLTRLNFSGSFDVNVAGEYNIGIYATDTDGNRSNIAPLLLKVK